MISAFHRKLRERTITIGLYEATLRQFAVEVAAGAFNWLPLSESILDRTELVYTKLPETTFLRAADALHLSTAAEHGFREIYSNDVKLLKAAAHFDMRGMDVIR